MTHPEFNIGCVMINPLYPPSPLPLPKTGDARGEGEKTRNLGVLTGKCPSKHPNFGNFPFPRFGGHLHVHTSAGEGSGDGGWIFVDMNYPELLNSG